MADLALMKGDKHPAVGELQAALNRLGARPRLAVDNDFGNYTRKAVLDFQLSQPKLSCTYGGIAGPETLDGLGILSDVQLLALELPLFHITSENWAAPLGVRRVLYSESGFRKDAPYDVPIPINYVGTAFVLSGYESLVGGRIAVRNGVYVFHGPGDPDRVEVKKNECAALVQAFGLPQTKHWRRGPRVLDANPLPGTVVATLRDDMYHNDYSGRSHVAIFLSKDSGGIHTLEQWNGRDIHRGYRKFKSDEFGEPDKSGKYGWVDDGDEYYILYSTQPCVGRDYA
jgi:hypothetical protein